MKNPTSLWLAQAGNLQFKNFIQDESAGGMKGEDLQEELLHLRGALCAATLPQQPHAEQNKKTQLQHLSKFSKIIQIVKAALDRRLKCSGLWKCPWKKCLSLCYHSALSTMRQRESRICQLWWPQTKPLRKKDLYSSVSTALHSKGEACTGACCAFHGNSPAAHGSNCMRYGVLPALTDVMGMKDAQQHGWHTKRGWEWTLPYGSSLQSHRWHKGKGRLLLPIAAADVGAKAEVCCKPASGTLVLVGERAPSL